MKLLNNLFCLAIAIFLISSCKKNDIVIEEPCTFEIMLEPICSFDPSTAQTVPFPVKVVREGTDAVHPDYEFNWSSNADFHGSAISITYQQLPLTVTVTEVATGCIGGATLEGTYWD